jgi:C4-type Zn-finger protein
MSFFEKKYYNKKMECPVCKKKVKPLIENNVISSIGAYGGHIGRVSSGLVSSKKYELVCPKCKTILTVTNLKDND